MLDYLGIFKKFNEEGIRYFVVGGMAVNLYGIPRMTYDIDILLDLEDRNIEKFVNLLKQWDFKPKVPVDISDFAKKEKRSEWIETKNMKAFNLVNPSWAIKEIDVIIDSPVDYAEAGKCATMIELQGVLVPTVGLDDLIKMKEITDRQQDEADIRYLKGLKDE
jgi:predicted nucleotidyltransferase